MADFGKIQRQRPMDRIDAGNVIPDRYGVCLLYTSGIEMAGGTPILIPAIGVCDGIAMGHVGMKYSLASREPVSYTHLDVYKRQGFVRGQCRWNRPCRCPGMQYHRKKGL